MQVVGYIVIFLGPFLSESPHIVTFRLAPCYHSMSFACEQDPQSIARFEGGAGGESSRGAPSKKLAKNWGNLVLAIDPNLLLDAPTFEARVRQTLNHVRQSGVAEVITVSL